MGLPIYSNNQNEQFYDQDLSQYLQNSLSDNGFVLPPQPTETITSLSPDMPDGTMWYDTTSSSFKVKIDGNIKTVTVT